MEVRQRGRLRNVCSHGNRRHIDQLRLEIDWDLHTDGPRRRLHGFRNSAPENNRRLFGLPDAMSLFADALEHAELIFAVMNVTAACLEKIRCHISRDVQEWCSAVPGFDNCTCG